MSVDVFLRPGDIIRNQGELWVVDYVNESRASALPVARITKEFAARRFKRAEGVVEEVTVTVAQKPKAESFSCRIERTEILFHVPGYVRGQKVHVEDLPEAIRPVARAKAGPAQTTTTERKEDSMTKRGSRNGTAKPRARGGLAAVAADAKTEKTAKEKSLGSLGGIMGHSATSVVRALGKAGVGAAHARAIVAAQGVKMKDSTVGLQLNAGRNGKTGGKDGKPVTYPDLSKADIEKLIASAADPVAEAKEAKEEAKKEKAAA